MQSNSISHQKHNYWRTKYKCKIYISKLRSHKNNTLYKCHLSNTLNKSINEQINTKPIADTNNNAQTEESSV